MFINVCGSTEQQCALVVGDLDPLIIPEGIAGACKADAADVIVLKQRERCRMQCKPGYAQNEIPYLTCSNSSDRTQSAGSVYIDKGFCTGAADIRTSK